ncbi:glycosyltransferase family 2 protein [Paludibaculum fermentans]|uniref:glycosyltransferase family 2 protein n=1 Tax=Paludibaculum fermentans TaxID=1473598 RepID=UPI003EB96396
MLLSILIPTLESRAGLYQRLTSELQRQVEAAGLQSEVEILGHCDDGTIPIGAKRNTLLQRSQGRYVVFTDDDDQVSANYVSLIAQALRANPDVDCLGIRVLIYFRGAHPSEATHSIQYTDLSSQSGRYFRPPYILNPIRRDIAIRYPFAEVRYSEDFDWAMRMVKDRALQREVMLEPVLYHYYSRRRWLYQYLLDRTEPLRHALGLRMDKRLTFWRRIKGTD